MRTRDSYSITLLGGRLAVDFANIGLGPQGHTRSMTWEQFIRYLEASRVISAGRGAQLLQLPKSDPQAANTLLARAEDLRRAIRDVFTAAIRKIRLPHTEIENINQVLRITEGHDELVGSDGVWRLAFIARESGPEWLLAAIARSAAEIVSEGATDRLRACANPACGLFFYDSSPTRRRRWCSMAVCGNRHKVAAFARRR